MRHGDVSPKLLQLVVSFSETLEQLRRDKELQWFLKVNHTHNEIAVRFTGFASHLLHGLN